METKKFQELSTQELETTQGGGPVTIALLGVGLGLAISYLLREQ